MLGPQIRKWRLERGIAQRDLAARAGIDPSTLSRLEKGYIPGSRSLLIRLANALGVSIEEMQKAAGIDDLGEAVGGSLDGAMMRWIRQAGAYPYLRVAKRVAEAGISPDLFQTVADALIQAKFGSLRS